MAFIAASGVNVYRAFVAPMPDGSGVPMVANSQPEFRNFGQTFFDTAALAKCGIVGRTLLWHGNTSKRAPPSARKS